MITLSTLRSHAGLSVNELARRSSVDAATISRIERGLQSPVLSTALSIANALGVDVTEIEFGGRQ